MLIKKISLSIFFIMLCSVIVFAAIENNGQTKKISHEIQNSVTLPNNKFDILINVIAENQHYIDTGYYITDENEITSFYYTETKEAFVKRKIQEHYREITEDGTLMVDFTKNTGTVIITITYATVKDASIKNNLSVKYGVPLERINDEWIDQYARNYYKEHIGHNNYIRGRNNQLE